MLHVYLATSASATTGFSALVGVLIGGAITILGQHLIERQRRKVAKDDRARMAMGIARLAWDEFWQALGTLQEALNSGEWWALNHQPQTELSNDDRRLLAEVVEWELWSDVTRSWRRLARLRADRESLERSGNALPLGDKDRALIEDAKASCERANTALESMAGHALQGPFEERSRDLRILEV